MIRSKQNPRAACAAVLLCAGLASCNSAGPPSIGPSLGPVTPASPGGTISPVPTVSPTPSGSGSAPCFLFGCGTPSPTVPPGGSASPSPTPSPSASATTSPTPTPSPSPTGGLQASPSSLAFLAVGDTQNFTVTQSGTGGTLATSTCVSGNRVVATVAPAAPADTFAVTAASGGNCTITVAGPNGSIDVAVQVTTTTVTVN